MALLDLHPVSDILLGVMRQAGIEDSVRWRSPTANVVRNLVGRGLAWTILIGLGTPLYSGEGRRLASVAITDASRPTASSPSPAATARRGG